MRRTFSVEDLLDEVEKICYDASGTSKVSFKCLPLNLRDRLSAHGPSAASTGTSHYVLRHILGVLTVQCFYLI